MDQQTLQLFSRQLTHWAENAISQGRFPFRKVETFPPLLTEKGEMRPPLVFWINRASCMAGGVLILPPHDAEEGTEMGRMCARALGLRHFATWAPREIVLWEERGEALTRGRSLPLPSENAAAGFRKSLLCLMEELKVLSVLGAVPPGQLSPHYLANLCRGTLLGVLPGLAEACRAARGERRLPETGETPEMQALHKGTMTLLRLIALTAHDLLPPTVQPEGLERAMRFALDTLPPGPRKTLSMAEEERPLPADEAVAFHHLFRRLIQLNLKEGRKRCRDLLEILLGHAAGELGGHPLPPHSGEPAAGPTILLNPDRLHRVGAEFLEAAPLPVLVFTSLLREMSGSPPAGVQCESPFALPPDARPATIRGSLRNSGLPQARESKALAAQLRASWPTRRFPLPPRTPRWAWEFLHLLGMARDGADIDLYLPDDWLTADFGAPMMELIREQFTITLLESRDSEPTRIRLTKGIDRKETTTLTGSHGSRELPWQRVRSEHRALLPLGLHLPDSLFSLLEDGFLRLPTSWSEGSERELYLFSRSALGRLLWETVGGGPLPPRTQLKNEILRRGMPVPEAQILENLRLLPPAEGAELPLQADFDRELALWLEADFKLPEGGGPGPRRTPPRRMQKASAGEELANEIARSVFVDGFPHFPEQYLYDYYRPHLVEYAFSGPLTSAEAFFDRFTLRDREGRLIEVEGAETAQALLLASVDGRSAVALPEDRHLTAAIVERYRNDLRDLHRRLLQQTHIRLTDPQAAESMAKRIWRSTLLPAPELVDI